MYDNFNNFMDYPSGSFFSISKSLSLIPGHMHAAYEISLMLEGTLDMVSNMHNIRISSPSIIIHKPYSLHSGVTTRDTVRYARYVIYENTAIKDKMLAYGINIDDFCTYSVCYFLLSDENCAKANKLFGEYITTPANLKARRDMIACLIFELVSRLEENANKPKYKMPDYITAVLDYITQNFNQKITLETLASRCFISRSKLTADFKRETGISIGAYLESVRISASLKKLTEGLSIIQTADECGYCSESHFVSAFRRFNGITPHDFVRKVRLN